MLSTVAAQVLTHLSWGFLQRTPFVPGFAAAVLASAVAGRAAGFLTVAFGLIGYVAIRLPMPPGDYAQFLGGYAIVSATFVWAVASRMEAAAALRASEARLSRIVTSLPMVLWAVDREGRVTLAQGRGLDMARLKPSELVGRSVFEIYRDVPELVANIERALAGESFTAIVDIHEHVSEMWYAPIRDNAGDIVGATIVSLDVTGRSQLEAQYVQAQKMESVGQMAAGVAHDFNNLLTAIGGYSEMVMSSFDAADPRRETLMEVTKAADRAGILTKQLLGFSRQQPMAPKLVPASLLVGQCQQLLRRTVGADIDISLELQSEDALVRVDPTQLELVLLNLAVNARDAMPTGGKLRLATSVVEVDEAAALRIPGMAPGRYVRFDVEDTGVGMPPEVQAKIFEPFFTTKGRGLGTGLGLATVRRIVEQSHGFVGVTSRVGQGTTFTIHLPVAEGATDEAQDAKPAERVLGGSETVLVAEDDAAVRRLAQEVLAAWGYAVLVARDGEEALLVAERHPGPIALLITDVVMPGLGGRQLAQRMAGGRHQPRVLYTSGHPTGARYSEGVEAGAFVLAKPFLPLDLVRAVRTVLDRRTSGGSAK